MTASSKLLSIQAGSDHLINDLTSGASLTSTNKTGPWVAIPVGIGVVGGVHVWLDGTAGGTAQVCLDYSNDNSTVAPVTQGWTSDPTGQYNPGGLTELQGPNTGAGCAPQMGYAFMRLRRLDSGLGNVDGVVSWNISNKVQL